MIRVGQGYDVHRLVEGRALILGGVTIPFEKGLDGHSDADVLIHALCDAMLGAAGLGDIGRHFPDTDPAYKGANSRELLREVKHRIDQSGYALVNADITVIAQAPKLAPYVSSMVDNLCSDLLLPHGFINIKATTTENLGFAGRGEGIAASAVVLVEKLK
ncbi:MAG: 2-C-methyl-D-erythritol 2,4-cyclodiphosphate synthase [Gammaproteobacteria bacterium]|nr:2-C-methyl-D-erythritol 2,4-cyclodiphosphate synthase [Gammaproteobacteria bacterium]